MAFKHHVSLIIAQLIFASNMILVRAAFKDSPGVSALLFAVGRGIFALAALLTIHVYHTFIRQERDAFYDLTEREQRTCYGIGVCGVTLNLVGVAFGIQLTDAITAGAFQCAIPPVSFLISHMVGERISTIQIFSLILAVAGNAMIVQVWLIGSSQISWSYYAGCLLLIVNVTAYSTFLVLQKPFVSSLPKMEFLFRVNLFGVPCLLLLASADAGMLWKQLVDGAVSSLCWASIAFAGLINSIVPYFLIAVGVSGASPTLAAIYFSLQPVFVCIMSIALLGEGLSMIRGVGGGLILAALAIGAVPAPQKNEIEVPGSCLKESPRHGELADELAFEFEFYAHPP